MEKRAFIAVGLSIAVFYLFSMLFGPDKQKVEPSDPKSASTVVNNSATKTQQTPVPQNTVPATGQSLPTNAPQKDISVETDLYTAVFSTRGASLKSLTLKNYREENSPAAKKVTLGNDADPNLLSFSTRVSGLNVPDSTVFMPDADGLKIEKNGSRN